MKAALMGPMGKGTTPLPINSQSLGATIEESEWSLSVATCREPEYERLLEELRAQVRHLQRQLAKREQAASSVLLDERELHEMVDEVERERKAVEREWRELEEGRRRIQEEKNDIRKIMGQMEVEMGRERAEHHRQQAEMKRREESLCMARENLARERQLVEGLRRIQRK